MVSTASTGALIEQEAQGLDKSFSLDPKLTASPMQHHLDGRAWLPAPD